MLLNLSDNLLTVSLKIRNFTTSMQLMTAIRHKQDELTQKSRSITRKLVLIALNVQMRIDRMLGVT